MMGTTKTRCFGALLLLCCDLRLATNQQIVVVVQIQGTRGMKGACKDLDKGLEEQFVNSVYLNQKYQSLSDYIIVSWFSGD
jgi:hypothetical protein